MGALLNQEQEYLNANPGKTRADFVAWANETVYTLVPNSIYGYGTVRKTASAILGDEAGKAIADGIRTWLQQADEGASILFMNGNIDFGLASTQAMIDAIPSDNVPSQVVTAIKDIGRTSSPRIAGVSVEALEAEELDERRAAFAALWNEVVAPNVANAIVPTEQQLKEFLGIA